MAASLIDQVRISNVQRRATFSANGDRRNFPRHFVSSLHQHEAGHRSPRSRRACCRRFCAAFMWDRASFTVIFPASNCFLTCPKLSRCSSVLRGGRRSFCFGSVVAMVASYPLTHAPGADRHLVHHSIVPARRIWRPWNVLQYLARHARQLCDVHRDEERLVARQQLRG